MQMSRDRDLTEQLGRYYIRRPMTHCPKYSRCNYKENGDNVNSNNARTYLVPFWEDHYHGISLGTGWSAIRFPTSSATLFISLYFVQPIFNHSRNLNNPLCLATWPNNWSFVVLFQSRSLLLRSFQYFFVSLIVCFFLFVFPTY